MRQAASGPATKTLDRRCSLARRCRSCVSVIALIMIGAGAADAQSSVNSSGTPSASTAKPAALSASPQKPAQAPASGLNTGIKVHGHWTIDVLNHDGTLANRVEFENGLTLIGAEALPAILGRTMTPGAWAVGLGYSNTMNNPAIDPGPGPCNPGSLNISLYTPNRDFLVPVPWTTISAGGMCYIAEAITGSGGSAAGYPEGCGSSFCFSNLSVSVVEAQTSVAQVSGAFSYTKWTAPQNQLQLQGTATAQNDGTIDTVATFLMLCAASSGASAISPASCATGNLSTSAASNFSFATLGGGGDAFSQLGQGSPPFGNSITGTYLNGTSPTSTPPAPIGVLATQVLRVTVLLSFS
jgi:hypothetical protein